MAFRCVWRWYDPLCAAVRFSYSQKISICCASYVTLVLVRCSCGRYPPHKQEPGITHTHILTSICRVKAPRPGTIGRGAGRMRRSCSQFRLPIFTTRSNTHTDTSSRRKRKQWKYRNGSSSKKISFVKNVTYSFATTSTVCSVFRYLNHRYHHHHHHPQQ